MICLSLCVASYMLNLAYAVDYSINKKRVVMNEDPITIYTLKIE